MPTQPLPATDSAAELHALIGDDATATFENDLRFIDNDSLTSASSENLEEQRPGAGSEFQAAAAKSGKGAGPDSDEVTDDLDDEEDDDEYDDDDDDDVDDDDEDEDEDLDDDDDLEDDEDDEDEDDDDDEDDDEDEEDDADELKASASPFSGTRTPELRADGLLGYEDEADDAARDRDRVTGDVDRKREQARKLTDDPDENPADAHARVDPSALREEHVDSNIVIRPVKPLHSYQAAL